MLSSFVQFEEQMRSLKELASKEEMEAVEVCDSRGATFKFPTSSFHI